MPEWPCPVAGCRAVPERPRHHHPCNDLNATGEVCWTCKVADWIIWFGHPLPTMIRCNRCGSGFNVSERLRATTNPARRRSE